MTPLERAARVGQDIEPPYSLIESAALSIMREDYPEEFDQTGELSELGQIYWHKRGRWYVSAARAVLQAIREPSEAMDRAAAECESSIVADVYRAMIDAALEEG